MNATKGRALLLLLGLGLAGCPRPEAPPPAAAPPAPSAPRTVTFTDVTAASGITFSRVNGATGEKLLPETMGGGVAFFDPDGDGDQDLLLVNGATWPHDPAPATAPTPALYRNDGTGRFEDVTIASGLGLTMQGMGVACGDHDGDGDTDLFFANVGGDRLFRNDGARFTDVTAEAGVGGDGAAWSASAGFFDFDRDSDLDLWVVRYVEWSVEIDRKSAFSLNGSDRAYGPPRQYRGTHSVLWRNEGGGRFTDVSAAAGLHVLDAGGEPVGKGLALTFVDVERDGFLDVHVANDTTRNFFFRNRGDGTFEELGVLSGTAFDADGAALGSMGVDAAAMGPDGRLAIAIANFAGETTSYYVQQDEPWLFTDRTGPEGIGAPSRPMLSFGLFFFDHDLDGRLDLLQANGHLDETIAEVQPDQRPLQPAQLFRNRGTAPSFEEAGASMGDLARPIVGRGAAYADIDGDGDLDVVLTQPQGPPLLLRNDQALGRHWLRVRLKGRPPMGEAIGARAELTAGGVTRRLTVMPTRSYLAQVELPLTFGLGDAAAVESLRVTWPDGTASEHAVPGVDRVLDIAQPTE